MLVVGVLCMIDISISVASQSFSIVFLFKQKTADEMRISDWSSDVCSSDLRARRVGRQRRLASARKAEEDRGVALGTDVRRAVHRHHALYREQIVRSEERRVGQE